MTSDVRFPPLFVTPRYPCHSAAHNFALCLAMQGPTKMFGCGPEHVYSVSAPRCIDILSHPYQPLPALTFALATSTLILLDPPTSRRYTYLLSCVEHFTRWPEAIPILDITAETIASLHLWLNCSLRYTIQPSPPKEDTSLSLNSSLTSGSLVSSATT